MSSKEFCESGKHSYSEIDVVQSMLEKTDLHCNKVWLVLGCRKCDSKFLREVVRPLP